MGEKLRNVPTWVWSLVVVVVTGASNFYYLWMQKNFVTRVEFSAEVAARTNYVTRVEYDQRHSELKSSVHDVATAMTGLRDAVNLAVQENKEHGDLKSAQKELEGRVRVLEIFCGPAIKGKP